ncbi:hypothetical protein BGZ97_000877 [Linnemannia gamsii]|jgi:hypothetical protein|uniref:F-box domain-containing protein n=1 Tax=Linnemannia gamsii TaxID=64522 RepID=A0A9P6UTE5_9FUNG|nr:hypothetical protein BGZ97_000877 [Linnemannia gamsii]
MHPLLLPELLGLISGYLAHKEQQRCSQVCWTWNSYFSPLVWKACTVDYGCHTKHKLIPVSALHTYAPHIRVLSFQGFVSADHFAIPCTRLEHLKIVDGSRVDFKGFSTEQPREIWASLARLVSSNPDLTTVEIAEIDWIPTDVFWKAVADHPGIRKLSLDQVRVEFGHLKIFWQACSGVEVLTLQRCRISNHDDTLDTMPVMFRRLQELNVENLLQPLPHVQIELLRLCPQLSSFYWRGGAVHGLARDNLLSILGSGRLPNLDSMDIMGMNLTDLDTEHIIHCMSRVRKLAVYQTNFGPSSIRSLEPHFKSIEELNLLQCPQVTSANVALLLRSCPLLRVLKAEAISSDEIKDGDVWPCHEHLRTLVLYFDLTLADRLGECHIVFALLSKLKNLRRLNISRYLTPHGRRFLGDNKSVQLRLDHGLGLLESLRHLEALYFDGIIQDMTMAEAQWMEEHWKALRTVRGVFTNSAMLNREITTFFKNTISGHIPLPSSH